MTLPYINDQTEQFSKRLTMLINTYFPKLDIKVTFKFPREIGNCFQFEN